MSSGANKEAISPAGMPAHAKPRKWQHEMKGPELLTPAQIKDIVEFRPNRGSRDILATKYGISVDRVTNIWRQFYGGSTLADYKTGLKKKLPTTDVRTADMNWRNFRSERGTYSARAPKVVDHTAKAAAVRKLAPLKKVVNPEGPTADLDLDAVDEMGDKEAQILAGELRAGNNNEELLTAIYELLDHNQNISDRAIGALENALKTVSKSGRRKQSAQYADSESNYEDSNIVTDTDDSTITYREERPQHMGRRQSERIREDIYEGPEASAGRGVQHQSAMAVHEESALRLVRPNQLGQELREGPPTTGGRAQPIYHTERTGSQQICKEQGNTGQASGFKSQISPAEYDPGQGSFQSNNAYNSTQQHTQPNPSYGLHSQSGDRPGEIVPGLSWLKKRPG